VGDQLVVPVPARPQVGDREHRREERESDPAQDLEPLAAVFLLGHEPPSRTAARRATSLDEEASSRVSQQCRIPPG
jgi:hypothetical protein